MVSIKARGLDDDRISPSLTKSGKNLLLTPGLIVEAAQNDCIPVLHSEILDTAQQWSQEWIRNPSHCEPDRARTFGDQTPGYRAGRIAHFSS
ncbi:MAG: hypothetical protein MAG451_02140 [Anaerolineales bacterium]|nr:hypothetical protein [Anaerolineales bacterium]